MSSIEYPTTASPEIASQMTPEQCERAAAMMADLGPSSRVVNLANRLGAPDPEGMWSETRADTSEHRRRAARPEILRGDIADLAPSSPSFESQIADTLLIKQLLALLPPIYSDVLRMAFLDDMAQQDIAKQLGVSRGTVVSRISRGLTAARIALLGMQQEA